MNKNQCIIVFGIAIALLAFFIITKIDQAGGGSSYYGTVVKLDKEAHLLTFAPRDKPDEEIYHVYEEDFMLLTEGAQVRGKRVIESDKEYLVKIWPAREEDEKILLELQHHLHVEAVKRPLKPMRDVGEYAPKYALYNQDGVLVRSSDWDGDYVVAAFIFTRCTDLDMCPATVKRLQELADKLDKADVHNYKLLGITMDPEYDTPSVLNLYAKGHKAEGITFLTGPWLTMRDLFRLFGITVNPDANKILEHSMMIALIGTDGEYLIKDNTMEWSLDTFYDKIMADLKGEGK